MAVVLHIVDENTRADMLEQMALLIGADDRVVSAGHPPRRTAGLTVTPVHRPMNRAALAGWRMRPAAESADVIHTWSPDATIAGRELALATGKPMVASLPQAGTSSEVESLRRLVGPGLLHATVPTRAARRRLIGGGLGERLVHVLPPAAEPVADRHEARRAIRGELGIPDGEFLAVVPDDMIRHAGHHLASWAHAIVREAIEGVSLLLPGDGPLADHVRFFAATTGFDELVHLTGDRFSRGEALAAADVALLFRERDVGVGPLVAAMAAALPAAVGSTPEAVEITAGEQTAWLVEPGDPRAAAAALLRLAEDKPLAARLARAARRRAAECFTPEIGRSRLAEIYAAASAARV